MSYRLIILPGDHIGPEIVPVAVRVLAAAAAQAQVRLELVEKPIGLAAAELHGNTVPAETREAAAVSDGILLGPTTTHVYDIFDPARPNPSAFFRKHFDLYANLRPARTRQGVASVARSADLVVVRENTEGFYADRNLMDGNGELRPDPDTVLSLRLVTRHASMRIARAGFALARARAGQLRVSLIHKANVLRRGDGLFLECCREVAKDYPEIAVDDFHIDAAAMHLVMRPEHFDVIITTNMFGDILSDEAAGLTGGLGLAAGLNAGDTIAMAQAVHGSAPDIAGRGIANPAAEILSAAMLLDWLGQRRADPAAREAARRIERAVDQAIAERDRLTPDLGGTAGTAAFGEAVLQRL
jgi:3-isopropylmalate dehydrogenase